MGLFRLEHSKLAYCADFASYAAAVVFISAWLLAAAPREQELTLGACTVVGIVGWTLLEYLLHRFVLHGLQPFRAWHEAHHDRPAALICTPTVLSAGLIVLLVYLPACWLIGMWPANAVTLGVLVGYMSYAVTHHMTHHWRSGNAWLGRRKRWHARHHHVRAPVCFGVTSGVWDWVFLSIGKSAGPLQEPG